MFKERQLSHRKRDAKEAKRKMLEGIVKYVVYNRVADNRYTTIQLIGKTISENVIYNNKMYEIKTRFTAADYKEIRRQTAKKV